MPLVMIKRENMRLPFNGGTLFIPFHQPIQPKKVLTLGLGEWENKAKLGAELLSNAKLGAEPLSKVTKLETYITHTQPTDR